MKRWIVIGVAMMGLMLGGAAFAYRTYRQNQPQSAWVPIPMNSKVPVEKQNEAAKDLKSKLSKPAILLKVCQDMSLAKEWGLASEEEAANQLARQLFVRIGDMQTKEGLTMPSMNVGVTGKTKDQALSGKISVRLMEDVRGIIGMPPPPKP